MDRRTRPPALDRRDGLGRQRRALAPQSPRGGNRGRVDDQINHHVGQQGEENVAAHERGRRRIGGAQHAWFASWFVPFAERIQNDENSVPLAIMSAATKCAHGGTSLRPNSSTPRNAASRKKAVSAS